MKKVIVKSETLRGILALLSAVVFFESAQALSLPTVSAPVKGAWIGTFSVATNYAFSTGTPLVMLWSNDECDRCTAFKESLSKPAFTRWQADQPYVFCYVEGVGGSDQKKNKGAKSFTVNAGGYGKKITNGYPMISLLWLEDGIVKSVATFSGRPGKMGVEKQTEMYQEFIGAIETAFADYGKSDLGRFPVTGGENDRFEAVPSTGTARIPVDRAMAGNVATNRLNVFNGGKQVFATEVVWPADGTRTIVDLPLQNIGGLVYDGGSSLNMVLTSPTDGTTTNGVLHLLPEGENSISNPYFPGERTVSNLDWADWTLDWTLVTNKIKAANAAGNKAYALAVFSGTLWCPYCKGIESSLFSSDEFSQWLRKNNVQLALFDQALSQSDAYAGGGHLLTYSAGLDHFSGVEHQLTSGAAYLTRHGLTEDDDEVRSVVARTGRLTVDWREPGSTAVRLSNPTILLLNADGEILGRLNAWRDRNKVLGDDVRYYDPKENIARLDELLKLVDRGENDDYASTTTLKHQIGSSADATLQVNSSKRYWDLEGALPGNFMLTRTDSSENPVVFTLYADGQSVATGTDAIEMKLTARMIESGNLRLGVSTTAFSSSANPLVSKIQGGGSFIVSFSTAIEPAAVVDSAVLPKSFTASVVLEELDVADGQKVSVRKTSGKLPSGVRIKYDSKTKSILLYGTPSKVTDPITFAYTVTITTGRVKETLEPVEVTVAVFDPAEINPYLGVARSTTIPLVGLGDTLVGTLTVSITARNRVSVKYAGISKKSLSFSGAWSELSEDGTVSLRLERQGVLLTLALDANGLLTAQLDGVTPTYSDLVTSGVASFSGTAKLGSDFSPFKGYYTVVLPVEDGGVAGTGYLTLTFDSPSSVKKGTVRYSVFLPNGRTMSGNSTLSLDPTDPDFALLPILKRSSADVFSALVRLQANGHRFYADDETVRVVLADESVVPCWRHAEQSDIQVRSLGLYGGWYPKGTTVPEWLVLFETQQTPFSLAVISPEEGVVSGRYGELAELPSATLLPDGKKGFLVAEGTGGVRISFNRNTGVFSGSGQLVFEDGKSIKGSYKGVLTPGWLDCGCGDERVVLPFGSGTFYYSDRVDGRTVKKSLGVELR